jgi:hypothetical protein
MTGERVVIASTSLPRNLGDNDQSVAYYQLLGPVLNAETLHILEETFANPGTAELHVAGYLSEAGYQVLSQIGAINHPELYTFLRPLGCSYTELGLSPKAIAAVPEDDRLMDLVMERYISNLLDDLLFFAEQRMPEKTLALAGFYLSRRSGRLLPCQPVERILTPRFGDLSFAVTRGEIRTFQST